MWFSPLPPEDRAVLVFRVVKLEPLEPGSAPPVAPCTRRGRGLRRFAAALVLATGAIGFAHVHAASAATFQACGRSGVANGGGVSCMTLSAAIAAAQATNGSDTIELFPGSYCPIAITDETGGITIRGIGLAGIQAGNGPTGLTGSEAELATFSWDSSCGGSAPTALITITNPGSHSGSITLGNLAVDGSGGGADDGIDITDLSGNLATLKDVEAENNTRFGIDYFGNDFEMDNSAAIGNAYGIEFVGEGSAVDSTFADNMNVGVELSNYDFHLINDTVSGNLWGVDAPGSGNHLQVVDTIVAGNGTIGATVSGGDCKSTVDWENAFSSHVLKGPSCTTGSSDDGSDIAFDTATTIPAPALNGGPTPSILPPSQAVGHGTSCAFSVDQREFVRPVTCTIGSVDPSANGTPDPIVPTNPLDFGQVEAGVTASRSETVSNSGGDYVGVSSVSATGGFTIGFDGCTYASLAPFGCSISVSLPTPAAGHYAGTLTIDTTGGDISVPLSADAVVRPVGNTDSYNVAFDRQLVVSAPGVLSNDAAGTTVFDAVDQPSNGMLEGPSSNGSFTYTPDNGFSGSDSFSYRIVDGLGAQSNPITVNLAVSAATFYVNSAWVGTTPGTDPDGSGPATSFGVDGFATITSALAASRDSTIIHVEAGTYSESSPDIENANVQLLGEGFDTTHLTVATSLVIEGGSDLVSGLDIHGTPSSGAPAVLFDDEGSTLRASAVSDAETGVFADGSGSGASGRRRRCGAARPTCLPIRRQRLGDHLGRRHPRRRDRSRLQRGRRRRHRRQPHPRSDRVDRRLPGRCPARGRLGQRPGGREPRRRELDRRGSRHGHRRRDLEQLDRRERDQRRRRRHLPERRQRGPGRQQRDHEQRDHPERRGRDPARVGRGRTRHRRQHDLRHTGRGLIRSHRRPVRRRDPPGLASARPGSRSPTTS